MSRPEEWWQGGPADRSPVAILAYMIGSLLIAAIVYFISGLFTDAENVRLIAAGIFAVLGFIYALVAPQDGPRQMSGGHSPQTLVGYAPMMSSRPAPPASERGVAITTGQCQFAVRGFAAVAGVDPRLKSPPLKFSATDAALWTFNPDGTLYARVDWDRCKRLIVELVEGNVAWFLEGYFVAGSFDSIQLIPNQDTAEAWLQWWAARGGEIENRLDDGT